jgi:hypothetical protein
LMGEGEEDEGAVAEGRRDFLEGYGGLRANAAPSSGDVEEGVEVAIRLLLADEREKTVVRQTASHPEGFVGEDAAGRVVVSKKRRDTLCRFENRLSMLQRKSGKQS